jgi:hypothetical protein
LQSIRKNKPFARWICRQEASLKQKHIEAHERATQFNHYDLIVLASCQPWL